jgi:hypothetical protein
MKIFSSSGGLRAVAAVFIPFVRPFACGGDGALHMLKTLS